MDWVKKNVFRFSPPKGIQRLRSEKRAAAVAAALVFQSPEGDTAAAQPEAG
jgi:hypothetical protein